MKLRCVKKYYNDPRGIRHEPGAVFEADEAQATFLLADAPGCFVKARAKKTKQVKQPPVDKAVKESEDK
jgi:hypothetical protein